MYSQILNRWLQLGKTADLIEWGIHTMFLAKTWLRSLVNLDETMSLPKKNKYYYTLYTDTHLEKCVGNPHNFLLSFSFSLG